MVGGRDYKVSQFNRADAQRPPGSAFKLFVYLAALRQCTTPTTPILHAPVTVSGWTPKNHEGKYAGREESCRSPPSPARPMWRPCGWPTTSAAIRSSAPRATWQITDPIPDDLTLALGTGPMSLVRLTAAYAAIDAGEAPVIPHGLADWKKPANVKKLSKAELTGMRDLLRSATQRGTGIEAAIPGAFGKTGTSQDYRDALFVGYVGDLVIGRLGRQRRQQRHERRGRRRPDGQDLEERSHLRREPRRAQGGRARRRRRRVGGRGPDLVGPDGLPINGAIPLEGQPAQPADRGPRRAASGWAIAAAAPASARDQRPGRPTRADAGSTGG